MEFPRLRETRGAIRDDRKDTLAIEAFMKMFRRVPMRRATLNVDDISNCIDDTRSDARSRLRYTRNTTLIAAITTRVINSLMIRRFPTRIGHASDMLPCIFFDLEAFPRPILILLIVTIAARIDIVKLWTVLYDRVDTRVSFDGPSFTTAMTHRRI